jgi:hypothetical protein
VARLLAWRGLHGHAIAASTAIHMCICGNNGCNVFARPRCVPVAPKVSIVENVCTRLTGAFRYGYQLVVVVLRAIRIGFMDVYKVFVLCKNN